MFKEIGLYMAYKTICQIIFNGDKSSYVVDDNNFLKIFRDVLEYYVSVNALNNVTQDNIFDYLSAIRQFKDENYSKRIQIGTEIIKLVNSQKDDQSDKFYQHELFRRQNSVKELDFYTDSKISVQDLFKESIYSDYIVLLSHSEITSNEEFEESFIPMLENKYLYYESINTILKECPVIFTNPLFYNRVVSVLNKNNKVIGIDGISKSNDKLLKKINRKTKKTRMKS